MNQLPEYPDLFHLKKQAKDLLKAYERKDASALQRFSQSLPSVQGKPAWRFFAAM